MPTEITEITREIAIKVIQQDYHRNGVGGSGFVATIFEWNDMDANQARGPFIAISFGSTRSEFIGQTAVLNIDMLQSDVGIAFARGNSWRGSDYCGPAIADAWEADCAKGDHPYSPWD